MNIISQLREQNLPCGLGMGHCCSLNVAPACIHSFIHSLKHAIIFLFIFSPDSIYHHVFYGSTDVLVQTCRILAWHILGWNRAHLGFYDHWIHAILRPYIGYVLGLPSSFCLIPLWSLTSCHTKDSKTPNECSLSTHIRIALISLHFGSPKLERR